MLKGIANAFTLYDDLGARAMSDIDVYIDPANINKAHELLLKLNWQTKDAPNLARLRFQYAATRDINQVTEVTLLEKSNLDANFTA
ncbi:MAG: hypothetical protein EBX97_07410 [Actinobacteria bacterium]|nr:hypothetical protein [Actinomycetota bacterium]